MKRRVLVIAIALLAAPALLGACGDDDDTTEAGQGEDTTTTAAGDETTTTTAAGDETTTSAPEAGGADAGLGVADSDLGQIVVDAEGFTLYAFLPDSATESACTGDCAANWPPVPAEQAQSVTGLDEAKLSTLTRDDGSEQVVYGGHPLYRFAADQAPGETNGQGAGDNWFAVAPDGSLIQPGGGGDVEY